MPRLPLVMLAWALAPGGLGCATVEPAPRAGTDADLALFTAPGPGLDDAAADLLPSDGAHGDGPGAALNLCDLHKLKINEVQTAGAAGATDEFVELYNPCSGSVALAGGRLVYRSATTGSDTSTFATFAGVSIPGHGYFVVANGAFSGTSNIKPFDAGGMAVPAGAVALKDSLDAIVDSVGWGTAVNAFVEGHACGMPGTGESAARSSDGLDHDDNATDFKVGTPSPGAAN